MSTEIPFGLWRLRTVSARLRGRLGCVPHSSVELDVGPETPRVLEPLGHVRKSETRAASACHNVVGGFRRKGFERW